MNKYYLIAILFLSISAQAALETGTQVTLCDEEGKCANYYVEPVETVEAADSGEFQVAGDGGNGDHYGFSSSYQKQTGSYRGRGGYYFPDTDQKGYVPPNWTPRSEQFNIDGQNARSKVPLFRGGNGGVQYRRSIN